jgi:hypothetical protein
MNGMDGYNKNRKNFGNEPFVPFIKKLETNSEGKLYESRGPDGTYYGGDYPDQVKEIRAEAKLPEQKEEQNPIK